MKTHQRSSCQEMAVVDILGDHSFIFLFKYVDEHTYVCAGPLPPFPSLLFAWEAGLQWTTCSRSSVPANSRWVWTMGLSGHRSCRGERSRCLCLCFLPGSCLGLVCPSAVHCPFQGSFQSCFCS